MTKTVCSKCGVELLEFNKGRKVHLCETAPIEVCNTFGQLYRGYPLHNCQVEKKMVTPGMEWLHGKGDVQTT